MYIYMYALQHSGIFHHLLRLWNHYWLLGRKMYKKIVLQLFFSKNVSGVLKRKTNKKFWGGGEKCSWGPEMQDDFGVFGGHVPPGGRPGSENDTLLPLIMTHDRRKLRNNPPCRSKSYRSENLGGGNGVLWSRTFYAYYVMSLIIWYNIYVMYIRLDIRY